MPFLYLENISKKFKTSSGDFYALKNINLEFPKKGFVAIVGKSGCGKSTLLNIILGSEKPTNGKVYFNNDNILKYKEKNISKYRQESISIVFQHYNLFYDLNVLDNILMPLLIKGVKKKDAEVIAKNLIEKFSLASLIERKCFNLSGGEKQRVAIARALITNPDIILCDEPTGALDETNSRVVMGILQEIAKERLVIIVSHNQNLVDEYCSRIITLRNGELVSDINNHHLGEDDVSHNKFKVSKGKWKNIFINKHFKSNLVKNLLTLFSTTFGLLATLLSIGFSSGIEETSKNAAQNSLYVSTALVSKKEYIEIENSPLQYEKSIRPEKHELSFLYELIPEIDIEPNLSYFISSMPNISSADFVLSNVSFLPIYDDENIASYQDVIVNDTFANEYGDYLNDLSLFYKVSPSIQTNDLSNPIIRDNFELKMDLNVVKVVEEFAFLNTPKIYYSYAKMLEYIANKKLDELSSYFGHDITCLDYVLDANNDSMASSFSSYIFIKNKKDINVLFDLKKQLDDEKSSIRLESNIYSIVDTYVNFMTSFSSSLNVFILISFIGVNFILGITSLSSFISHKKESAILTVLGARNKDIVSIFLNESISIVLLSLILGFILLKPAQTIVNNIVNLKARIPNIISVPLLNFKGIPFGLPLGIVFITLAITSIFVLVPLLIYKNISLTNELKDE